MIPITEMRKSLEKNANSASLSSITKVLSFLQKHPLLASSALAAGSIGAGIVGAAHTFNPFLQMRRDKKKLNVMDEQKKLLSEILREQKGDPSPNEQRLFVPPLS